MLHMRDVGLQSTLDAFESLGLNDNELEVIENYLRGEAGEEILEKLSFRNLEHTSDELRGKFCKRCDSLIARKQYKDMSRLVEVLFQLGESTCAEFFPNQMFFQRIRAELDIKPEKMAAVYAQKCKDYFFGSTFNNLKDLAEIGKNNPSFILSAIEHCKSSTINAKVLLLTVYFWTKYSNSQIEDNKTDISKEDVKILTELENMMLDNMNGIFVNHNSSALQRCAVQAAEEAIRKDTLTDAHLQEIKNVGVVIASEALFRFLGACAFVNYVLSEKLRGVISVCAAVNDEMMLNIFASVDLRDFLKNKGKDFDDIFHINPEELIKWTAEAKAVQSYLYDSELGNTILKTQFKKHRGIFLECLRRANMTANHRMMNVIRESDKDLYEKLIQDDLKERREKLIHMLIDDSMPLKNECIKFLHGETQVKDLYAIEDTLANMNVNYYGYFTTLENYRKNYHDEELYQRVLLLMAVAKKGYFFSGACRKYENGKYKFYPENAKRIFQILDEGGLDVAHQISLLCALNDTLYTDTDRDSLVNCLKPLFFKDLKERPQETIQAFQNAEAFGRYYGLCVMEQEADNYKKELLSFSQDSANLVKTKLVEILQKKKEWHEDIVLLLSSKKAAQRELGVCVIAKWGQPEDIEALQKLLEIEKSVKVRSLLESALQVEVVEDSAKKVFGCEDLVKNLHKGGKKRTLAWAYETPFSDVHDKKGELVSEEYLQAILLCYTGMSSAAISRDAKLLAEILNEAEFSVYVNELFDKWLEAGAEAKKRWVMYVASIHGESEMVRKLHHQIQEWPAHARGSIAADAVMALALSPQPQALLMVDAIARKFKFKQVKTAAGKALELAAAELGLTREELEDKIVLDLGFDEQMERHFDYGERSFTVTITPALEIEVFDEKGKKLKNLPAPGKKDEEEKAKAAYAEFKEMKKQLKTTISSQKMRLELALSAERVWSVDAWKELFVKNPVMHQFAIGLIWGVYEGHELKQSFRYMEDGSFNTEDEDEYVLPEHGKIALVHPIELSMESRDAWKQQLEDYEIAQPIEQLNRPIYYRTAEEESLNTLERFGGVILNSLSLSGKLQQLGWYRGSVLDAGGFYTFYREDASIELGVELHFSGAFVGDSYDGGEDVTIYDARFYKANTIQRGSYRYDEVDEKNLIPLNMIPKRYFSEIVLQLSKVTASSQERDENWKSDI